jgi:hypothetical protein
MDAQLHEGPEHRFWDPNMTHPYENQWNQGKPLDLNVKKDNYEERWQQRIGPDSAES